MRWFTGKFSKVWVRPLGQRTVARTGPSTFPTPKKSSLVCWDRNPEPAWRYFVWRMCSCLDGHRGANCIAITFLSAQAECDGVADFFHRVAQDSQLWRVPVLEDNFQSPIVVEVGKNKRSAVVGKVQTHRAGHFRKFAVAIIGVENVSLETGPGRVRADQFIDGVPSLLVVDDGFEFCGDFPTTCRQKKLERLRGSGPEI